MTRAGMAWVFSCFIGMFLGMSIFGAVAARADVMSGGCSDDKAAPRPNLIDAGVDAAGDAGTPDGAVAMRHGRQIGGALVLVAGVGGAWLTLRKSRI